MSPKYSEHLTEHIPPGDVTTRSAIKIVASTLAAGLVLTLLSAAWAAKTDVTITRIEAMDGPDSTVVKVHTSARPVFTVFKQERPPRLVLTLNNARIKEAPGVAAPAGAVRQISMTQFKTSVKMVISLAQDCPFFVQSMGTSLLVTLSKGEGAVVTPVRQTAAKTKTHKQAKASLVRVKDIRLVNGRAGSQIKIMLDGQAPSRVRQDNGHPVLELEGVQLPRLLQRTHRAVGQKGPIAQIKTYTSKTRRGRAYIKVALKNPVTENSLRRVGKTLLWDFQAAPHLGMEPEAQPALSQALGIQSFEPAKVAGTRKKKRAKRYKGRRIDLDFKDADIHNILRLLSDVGTVNIITSDSVKGKVTIRMKNIPWDQALDVILRAKGLGQVREGNLIRVALITDLAKEREAELARMKQVALLKPLETRLIPLSYAQASKILPKLKYTISPRGKLTYDERTNMVIARDIAGNLDLMERLIHNLDTQTPQVLIEARIVEARSNFTREIGVQWGGNVTASPATGNPTGLVFPSQIGLGGGAMDDQTPVGGLMLGQATNPNFAVNLPAGAGTGSGGALGLTLGSISGNVNINLRLSAAETLGNIRIVSSPRVTTLDNIEANIEQGVTIPYSQVSATGVQTTFKDAKLQLTVKPHVTADGSVIMKVDVTRNEVDFINTGARGEPTILTKSAKTVMLVKDGDTAVIGGIYTTRTGRAIQKVPWFGDIPILGFFFKYKRDSSDREEVLVFITPRIINRAQSIGQ